MFRWLRRLIGPSSASPAPGVLLNDGLELAMDWGENWLAPVQDRLHQLHPDLRPEELNELNAACQEAMKVGHEIAYELVRERGQNVTQGDFILSVQAKHPWINAGNGARLFNQSMYYAWKTGGPPRGA